ncbi:MAG TPA: hypothetical protein VFF74_11560 [Methylophilaceae bacterium]|nr:hypothetical protein [Methylophilaceae bacterium]
MSGTDKHKIWEMLVLILSFLAMILVGIDLWITFPTFAQHANELGWTNLSIIFTTVMYVLMFLLIFVCLFSGAMIAFQAEYHTAESGANCIKYRLFNHVIHVEDNDKPRVLFSISTNLLRADDRRKYNLCLYKGRMFTLSALRQNI